MTGQLKGHRVAILATDGVEQDEVIEPRHAVEAAGAAVVLISLEPGEIQAFRGDVQPTDRFPVDLVVSRVSVDDFDGLILPGGALNPDRLRVDDHAVAFVRHFVHVGKPVGAIGHGPWMLIEADAVGGRTLTSWPSLRTDIINAGGIHVNEKVVVDRNLITSRGPADLHWFCAAIVGKLTQHPEAVGQI